jgi:predicted anti-sigma-YlaC factor YlaD
VRVDEIVCREFSELATDYLEAALPGATLELVEEHLAMCHWCRDYLHQIELSAAVLADVPAPEPPPEALDAVLRAYRAQTTREGPG